MVKIAKSDSDSPRELASIKINRGAWVFEEDDWRGIQTELALSPRELEIVQGFFEDRSEMAMARQLGISEHTVHTYVRRIYSKLGVTSRCQLLLCVMEIYIWERKTALVQKGDGIQHGTV